MPVRASRNWFALFQANLRMGCVAMQEIKLEQTSSPKSHLLLAEKCVLRYREVLARAGARVLIQLLRERLVDKWCIWRDAFRSFRGHIRTQSAKGRATVTFGPWFENHQGHPRRNLRTVARRIYTERLRAILPWADSQDLRIFLMGFDAGEKWASRSDIRVADHPTENASSWLALSEKDLSDVLEKLSQQRS